MTLKRLYSGYIGKKNINGSVVYENSSNKSSWERFEIFFRGTQKSETKQIDKNIFFDIMMKMISYEII